jgi:hypothetical protein
MFYVWSMTPRRMAVVGVVDVDPRGALAFFSEVALELEGEMPIESPGRGNMVEAT